MANVREMVNTHLPVALKLINSAALVAICLLYTSDAADE